MNVTCGVYPEVVTGLDDVHIDGGYIFVIYLRDI